MGIQSQPIQQSGGMKGGQQQSPLAGLLPMLSGKMGGMGSPVPGASAQGFNGLSTGWLGALLGNMSPQSSANDLMAGEVGKQKLK